MLILVESLDKLKVLGKYEWLISSSNNKTAYVFAFANVFISVQEPSGFLMGSF